MSVSTLTRTSVTRIVPPQLSLAVSPAALVLRAASTSGPVTREVVARTSGLSSATVNRQVSALLTAGLIRERADLAPSGAVGRPRIPVDVDHATSLAIGVHIGAVSTSIVAADLRGRILGSAQIATPTSDQHSALADIANAADVFTSRWHTRRPLWVGVALGGRVDVDSGSVDHPRLGWVGAPVGRIIGDRLGFPVSVSPHVEAMAASELLLAPEPAPTGSSLYFYARETTGVAITIDGRVHTPSGGPGSIAHLPTGSSAQCSCGRTGCLEASVSDSGVLARARAAGIVDSSSVDGVYAAARSGSAAAQRLLVERADALGRAVAMLRDVFNPDRVLLGGQAFSAYTPALRRVSESFAAASVMGRSDLRVSGFGNRVQDYAAAAVALSPILSDPIGAMRKVGLCAI